MFTFVFVESPYAGNVARNEAYARACVADCIKRGENPMASHLFFTQPGVLDDKKPDERKRGIELGFAWAEKVGAKSAFYVDLGVSGGMQAGILEAARVGRRIEFRTLPADAMAALRVRPDFAEADREDPRAIVSKEEAIRIRSWAAQATNHDLAKTILNLLEHAVVR